MYKTDIDLTFMNSLFIKLVVTSAIIKLQSMKSLLREITGYHEKV